MKNHLVSPSPVLFNNQPPLADQCDLHIICLNLSWIASYFALMLHILQVLCYLARIEPFTTISAQLQGPNSNHDDCIFSDVTRTWNSVLEGMNDVKELVSFVEKCAVNYFTTEYWHCLILKSKCAGI